MYSKELADMVLSICDKINLDPKASEKVTEAILVMGPSAFFDTLPNEEQAKGAIEVLKWIESYLDYISA